MKEIDMAKEEKVGPRSSVSVSEVCRGFIDELAIERDITPGEAADLLVSVGNTRMQAVNKYAAAQKEKAGPKKPRAKKEPKPKKVKAPKPPKAPKAKKPKPAKKAAAKKKSTSAPGITAAEGSAPLLEAPTADPFDDKLDEIEHQTPSSPPGDGDDDFE
jgi:hypothetical protein